MYTTGIKSMASDERPRERLLKHGAGSLHNRELLAIVLASGAAGLSALDLADCLLSGGGLRGLNARGVDELSRVPGVGPARVCQVKAALELGLRLAAAVPESRPTVATPSDVAALVMGEMRYLDREVFKVVLLDTKNHVIEVATVSVGTLDSSHAHPRESFKRAVMRSAASVIFVHNHPSGDPEPSQQDYLLTRRLTEAGEILGIEVLDHIVIGDNRFASVREKRGL